MTKYEFLGDLSRLLKDLPEEERKQALHYYEDYFADAGEDNEQEVLNELGSPENIAELIKADSPDEITYGDGASTHATAPLQPYKAAGRSTLKMSPAMHPMSLRIALKMTAPNLITTGTA